MEEKKPKEQLYYINTVKTLGIILVLFLHLTIPPFPSQFINSVSMPLFLFVSGFLFNTEHSPKRFFSSKFRTLIIPYFFFACISFSFWFISSYFIEGQVDNECLYKYIVGIFYAPSTKEFLGFNIPLWFLACLFSSEVIFFFILRYLKKYAFIASCVLFGLGILTANTLSFRLPWGMDVAFFSVLFLYWGYWVKQQNIINKYLINKPTIAKAVLAILSFGIACWLVYLNGIDGKTPFYLLHLNNHILFIFGALFTIIGSFSLATLIPKKRILNFLGRNTIILLGLHLMIFASLKAIQVYVFKIPLSILMSNITYNLIYVVLTILICIPLIIVINKYAPFLIGRKKAIFE